MKIYKCIDLDACGFIDFDVTTQNTFIKGKLVTKDIGSGDREIKDAFISTTALHSSLFDIVKLEYKDDIFDLSYNPIKEFTTNEDLFGLFKETIDLENYTLVGEGNITDYYPELIKVKLAYDKIPYCFAKKDFQYNIKKTIKIIANTVENNDFLVFNNPIENDLITMLNYLYENSINIKEARRLLSGKDYNEADYSDRELYVFGKICNLTYDAIRSYKNYQNRKLEIVSEIFTLNI